jgi:RNA polymerase sigma factor (sigma-70 family)
MSDVPKFPSSPDLPEALKRNDLISYFSRAHWKRTYGHARSIVQNTADAEDIAQETYIRLFQNFMSGNRIESCIAWMRGVLHNVAVQHFRQMRPDLHMTIDEEKTDDESSLADSLSAPGDSVEEKLIEDDLLREALCVLGGLPDLDRECILMYARGYKYVQIAKALGISYETAIRTTRRALEKTRKGIERLPWTEKQRRGSNAESKAVPESVTENVVEPAAQELDWYTFGEVTVDVPNRKAIKAGEVLTLSAKEFDLLRYMLSHAGKTLSREVLLKEVWGYEHTDNVRTVDTHVSWLRQKVEPDPRHPRFIVTARNVGYRFSIRSL